MASPSQGAHAKDGAWYVWTSDAWRIALGNDATLIGTSDGGTREGHGELLDGTRATSGRRRRGDARCVGQAVGGDGSPYPFTLACFPRATTTPMS
jgi:hypothetical protein